MLFSLQVGEARVPERAHEAPDSARLLRAHDRAPGALLLRLPCRALHPALHLLLKLLAHSLSTNYHSSVSTEFDY